MSNREKYILNLRHGGHYIKNALLYYKNDGKDTVNYELFKKAARKNLLRAKELRMAF